MGRVGMRGVGGALWDPETVRAERHRPFGYTTTIIGTKLPTLSWLHHPTFFFGNQN